ncbi:putative WASP-binding domain of Sorting nexin protein [Lyophyllum shimeji]|uniref:WASP-binding domain of Sorting nexin protein n=1 Tax=Lyophyllum shimeji TaxID=47721 RepID=A0A9P3PUN4_LYOSH|nr:putative WASP-binding domain of Sorting nexin protein [Lyophyllum shimeji]
MATLPRASKISPPTSTAIFQRPVSEFDAGLNTSAAWTAHLESGSSGGGSLSDEEPDHDSEEPLRPARALYDFEGKPEFRELTVSAGDVLEVVKEDLADGWSLVKNTDGEIGLLPRSYYTFTSDFTPAPDLELPSNSAQQSRKEASSTDDATPRGSPRSTPQPIVPQNTGEWRGGFPSFRQNLLGGKSLNRFSSFVTSGAEEFVLKGTPAETLVTPPTPAGSHNRDASDATFDEEESNRLSRLGLGEADRHFVDAGPAWKEKIPPFRVLVHSPSKRTSVLSGAYTMYSVTSLFQPASVAEQDESATEGYADPDQEPPVATPPVSPTRITVYRRFSHFVILHTALTRRLPGIALPPLPEKQYAGRFSEDFVEARRGDLERYIGKIIRHPIARYAEVVTFFLGCESDAEWKRLIPQHLAMPAAGPTFYARVFHPAFNLDAEDAQEAVERFEVHTKAVGKGVQGLRNIFGRIREARLEMSKAERLLGYSLLSLITSKPLVSAPTTGMNEDDDLYDAKSKGLLNDEGAWCWREGCRDCLKLTKAMQKASETMQSVADLYDDHARRTQLATHESLKAMAHPSSLYEPIVTTHKSTLSRYQEATREGRTDEAVAARCETVLNTTMAEMETYHTQKWEDFRTLTMEHLDGEIRFYEQVLSRLKATRRAFDPPVFDELANSRRQPSIYERELENPRLTSKPLLQPCPHVFDSAPMRPVSVAIQEGVGLLLGPSTRGSVFGKFW